MAHPGRGLISTRRAFRSIPRRESGRLLNRQNEELAFIDDLSWAEVSFRELPGVVNLQNETRTWKIPMIQSNGITPVTGYSIRTVETGTLWEIQSVSRAQDMWHCVTTLMNEHDQEVP